MIHQIQFSNFFFAINHIPVYADADANESPKGTLLFVHFDKIKYSIPQQTTKKPVAPIHWSRVDADIFKA